MNCPVCNTPMQLICYVYSCGVCYERELLSANLKLMRPPVGKFEYVYDPNKHMMIDRKVK